MLKLNLIGGEPCTGKSTIVKYIKNCKEDIINCNNVSNLRWLSANENIS